MSQQRENKQHSLEDEDSPFTPGFPRVRHPQLDPDKTEDVDEPANRDDVEVEFPETPRPPKGTRPSGTSEVPEPPS